MPFPRHEGVVAGVAQNLGESNDPLIEIALIPGHTALGSSVCTGSLGAVLPRDVGPFDQVSEPGDVVVGACHDHGTGGSVIVT